MGFPSWKQASVGMGTGIDGLILKKRAKMLRENSGLEKCETIRKEGALFP